MSQSSTHDPFLRAAGLGGLGFVAAVLLENVLRAPPPMPRAPFAEVARYYVERGETLAIADAFFVLAIPCLLVFAIGTARRLAQLQPAAAPWAIVAALAVSLMTASFGVVMLLDITLIHLAPSLDVGLGTLLWTLKNAAFSLNMVPLATGLTAFGVASSIARAGSRSIAVLAVGGGLLGLAGTMPMVANLRGSPFMWLGGVSFLCWLTFVIATSVGHLRARG